MERLLGGRIALITGGASGQGRAAAVLFAEHGARIVVADIDDDGAGDTIAMVDDVGSSGIAVHADISRRAATVSTPITRRAPRALQTAAA